MKLCTECLSELFDREERCYKCSGVNLISQSEYNRIKHELQTAKNNKKKVLLQDSRYLAVFKHYENKENWIINLDNEEAHKQYKCSSCGRIYNDDTFYCKSCGEKLVDIALPYVPPTQPKTTSPTVVCPYCKSEDTMKISKVEKAVNTWLFGLFGTKRYKEWHCNNCNSDF